MPKFFEKLFPKKDAPTWEELQARLSAFQEHGDCPGLVRTYHAMGARCMDRGDGARALLYLRRAETIFSARDAAFSQTEEKLMDDCSARIGALEKEPLLENQVLTRVEEQAEGLEEGQTRLWGLFTLARFVQLGRRLSVLPGCDLLDSLDRAVELVFRSLGAPIPDEDVRYLSTLCDLLYTMSDSESYTDLRRAVDAPGGAPFQLFDLNGMLTLTEMNLYLDSHLTLLGEGPGAAPAETGLIPCGLLPDYRLRTGEGELGDHPAVQAELARIWSDLEFVRGRPAREEAAGLLDAYSKLDLLA